MILPNISSERTPQNECEKGEGSLLSWVVSDLPSELSLWENLSVRSAVLKRLLSRQYDP